jgi:hypothetical protein
MTAPLPAKGIDVLVQDAIRHARSVKPNCTAREAAEITARRPLADAEWQRKAPIWLRNWDGGTDPASAEGPSASPSGSAAANAGSGGSKPDTGGSPRSAAPARSAPKARPGWAGAGTPRRRRAA